MEKEIIYVDKVYYSEKENVEIKNAKDIKSLVREIQTVSDYLRAITMILSNYLILDERDLEIKCFENVFSLKPKRLKEAVDRIYFRGQSKEYEFVIPGIYRNIEYLKNEKKMIEEAELSYPKELRKIETQTDKLALMQHYGLPTRILDITTNALIALYFAVSDFEKEDGIVYLFDNRDKKKSNSKSNSVVVKVAVAKLLYEDKILLNELFSKEENKELSIQEYLETKVRNEIKTVIEKVCENIQSDIGFIPKTIKISDFYGIDFVHPIEMEERIIRQSGTFMVFGLDGLENNVTEESIQNKIDEMIHKYEIRYSPENGILIDKKFRFNKSMGEARIKIKKEYKNQLKNELEMIGIIKKIVYPDMQNKSLYIKEKYEND